MLELKNISYKICEYTQEKAILSDINLILNDDEFVAITGSNGSGKSTLAKLIMGIIAPSGGHILMDGVNITNLDTTERAKIGIGYAFQQPVKFKGIKVYDLLKIASGGNLSQTSAFNYLRDVGLCASDYLERDVNTTLSGGELKRIEIAMLLARRSKLSVFDEPEAGIDLWSFQKLTAIFNKIRSCTIDKTIVVISHQERILRMADKIYVMSAGRITKSGTPKSVLPEIMSSQTEVCDS